MLVRELKEELEARSESKTGNKAWLRRRLHSAIVHLHGAACTAQLICSMPSTVHTLAQCTLAQWSARPRMSENRCDARRPLAAPHTGTLKVQVPGVGLGAAGKRCWDDARRELPGKRIPSQRATRQQNVIPPTARMDTARTLASRV